MKIMIIMVPDEAPILGKGETVSIYDGTTNISGKTVTNTIDIVDSPAPDLSSTAWKISPWTQP